MAYIILKVMADDFFFFFFNVGRKGESESECLWLINYHLCHVRMIKNRIMHLYPKEENAFYARKKRKL